MDGPYTYVVMEPLRLRNVQMLMWLFVHCNVFSHLKCGEASVAERLSYPLSKPGVMGSIPGFSSLSDET